MRVYLYVGTRRNEVILLYWNPTPPPSFLPGLAFFAGWLVLRSTSSFYMGRRCRCPPRPRRRHNMCERSTVGRSIQALSPPPPIHSHCLSLWSWGMYRSTTTTMMIMTTGLTAHPKARRYMPICPLGLSYIIMPMHENVTGKEGRRSSAAIFSSSFSIKTRKALWPGRFLGQIGRRPHATPTR